MLHVTRAVLPLMRRGGQRQDRQHGLAAGKEGLAYLAVYSAASAGVIGFTKAPSREVVRSNIFVNCVAPGPIDTDMIRSLGADRVAAMVEDSPMKRLGSPDLAIASRAEPQGAFLRRAWCEPALKGCRRAFYAISNRQGV
jgi:NAD(P)-dependent dehydrogenase (short-subunit alcohol dehydrogenase family)